MDIKELIQESKKLIQGSKTRYNVFGEFMRESSLSVLNRFLICECIKSNKENKLELAEELIKDLKINMLLETI